MNVECSYSELIDPSVLVENPRNPNKHSDRQIELLAKIINHTGFRHPIVVSKRSGFIVAGHGRLMAAKKLSLNSVPVDYQEFANEAEEFQFLIADNKIAELADHDDSFMIDGIKDLELDDFELLGLDGFQLPLFADEAKEEVEDDVPTDVDTRCKLGDVWLLDGHRLLCGDATNIQHIELLMDNKKADIVFTDPPYGINFEYNSYKDTEDNWYDLIDGVMPLAKQFSDCIIMPCCRITALEWWYTNHPPDWIMCWYKGSPGHRSKIGFNDWEPHLVWGKPKNCMHDYWQTACGFKQEGDKHSCPKPIEYSEWVISRAIDQNDILLDLFGGSGSTLIACEKTNRKCYMMELDPHYCDVILSRWEKYSGKEAKLYDNGQT